MAAQLISELLAVGFAMGIAEGASGEVGVPAEVLACVRAKAKQLPIGYYSEVFNCLVVPPEEGVVGDLVDDIIDIHGDLYPGLVLFDAGRKREAQEHWQYWFPIHWGEHATSALRALWSYLAGREGRAGPQSDNA